MKIHGTAKGGALSKKDFGVAFGGGAVAGYVNVTWGEASDETWVNDENSTYRTSGAEDWIGYNSGQSNCNPSGTLNNMEIKYQGGTGNYAAIGFSKQLAADPSNASNSAFLSFQVPSGGVRYYRNGVNQGTIAGSTGFDIDTVFTLIMESDKIEIYVDDVLKVEDSTTLEAGNYYAWCTNYTLGSSAKSFGRVKDA